MADPRSSTRPEHRGVRRRRLVLGVGAAVAVVAAPLVAIALADGSSSDRSGPVVETPDALDRVRAAVGQTATAGSYEMDTVSTTSVANGPSNRFTSHSVVNLEPYAMVSESETPFGHVTLHVNATHVWQRGGATVGYEAAGAPGVPITSYSRQVLGTLGPGPGALAMISIASRGGHLNLEEQAVATAEPAGTGTVGDVPVTYYDVTIDVTKLADAPDLSDAQRSTIEAALPTLRTSGYEGTTERIGVDADGFVREITATTTMRDGSTTTRHSVLYSFGCAPRVTMPNEPRGDGASLGPCLPVAPTTTTVAPTTSTSAPIVSTSVVTTTVPATVPASTVPTSAPVTTTTGSGG